MRNIFYVLGSILLAFLCGCTKFWGPTDFGPLPHHIITKLVWSPDGKQLAFTGRYDYSPKKLFDDSLYLIQADGSNLKKLEDSPIDWSSYILYSWFSENSLLTGDIGKIFLFQLNSSVKSKQIIDLNLKKERILNFCKTKEQNNFIFLRNSNKYVKIFNSIILTQITEKQEEFPLTIQWGDEFKNTSNEFAYIVYSLACLPISQQIYLKVLKDQDSDSSTKRTFYHALGEVDIQEKTISNLKVFYTQKENKEKYEIERLTFLGWLDTQTIFYFYQFKDYTLDSPLISHFYTYNTRDKSTQELKNIAPGLAQALLEDRPFAISPDFKQFAYASKNNETLLLSDLEGKNVKTLLKIDAALSEKEKP
jgi:hypothetical protein